MKISDIFDLIQGHQITDEEIYNSVGSCPVYTGSNEIKGYWSNKIIEENKLPCLTYPTKANIGVVFIQNQLFDANNTAVLIPKEEWRDQILFQWFKYKLPSIFLKIMTSKSGVSYLNKAIVKNYEINLPGRVELKIEIEYFQKLDRLKQELMKQKKKLDSLVNKSVEITSENEIEEITISNIFSYISRNDSLSEEGVYNNFPQYDSEDNITVLSGSTKNKVYGKISSSTKGIHYLQNRQCLHVVTRGKAGKLAYVLKGTYATNTNAYLIFIKKDKWSKLNINNEAQEEIYLKFMSIYLQPLFFQEASKSDVGVFVISMVMDKLLIPKFKYNVIMEKLVRYHEKLDRLNQVIESAIEKIDKLISKDIL